MNNYWFKEAWDRVAKRMVKGSLPHALLLTGPSGLGKSLFAEALYKAVLCESVDESGYACGKCKSCLLIQAGTHPDIYKVGLEDDSKVIKIDQIRALNEKISKTSQLGGYRIGVISPAERMNTNAANSLLKTLEEPGANALLILISSQPGVLPATIRSRCQKISFSTPDKVSALAWLNQQVQDQENELALALCSGSPIAALNFLKEKQLDKRNEFIKDLQQLISGKQNPISLADKWAKLDPQAPIYWLQSWARDLVRLKSTEHPPIINNIDIISYLKPLAQQLDLQELFIRLANLEQAGRQLQSQANPQLLLEETLMAWTA